jgi:hypothetical protein
VSRCGFVDIKVVMHEDEPEKIVFYAPSHICSIQQGDGVTFVDTVTGMRHLTREPAHTLAMRCAAATSDVGRNTNWDWDDVDIGASVTRLCTYWRYT